MTIRTSVESARGCGYRQPGGIYLVGDFEPAPCGRLPIPLTVCSCCGAGIKPTRGWTWIAREALNLSTCYGTTAQGGCQGCFPTEERMGLLWVGEAFYKTPAKFRQEASMVGISRRIAAVPKGFEVGKTRVLLAHRHAIKASPLLSGDPAIFAVFTPKAIEYIVTGKESPSELDDLEKRGFNLVKVIRADGAQISLEDQLTPFTIFYRDTYDGELLTMKIRSHTREKARESFKKSFPHSRIVSVK